MKSSLRYGENPHQKAAFYVDKSLSEVNGGGIATAVQHHGKVCAKLCSPKFLLFYLYIIKPHNLLSHYMCLSFFSRYVNCHAE